MDTFGAHGDLDEAGVCVGVADLDGDVLGHHGAKLLEDGAGVTHAARTVRAGLVPADRLAHPSSFGQTGAGSRWAHQEGAIPRMEMG